MDAATAATIARLKQDGYRIITPDQHIEGYIQACKGRGPWHDEVLIDGDQVLPNDAMPYPGRIYMRREEPRQEYD